jgi:regulator of replication initiation timing
MKRKIFIIALCLSLSLAQEGRAKNMKLMMKWQLTEYLDLEELQAEKFFPKMNSHEKRLSSINKEIIELKNNLEKQISSNTASKRENKRVLQNIRELEKKKIDTKFDYIESLDGILTPSQVSKLMVFDKKFKKSLKEQIRNNPSYKGKHRR